MREFAYKCCCVDLSKQEDVAALNEMTRNATEVTYLTFRKHARSLDQWAVDHGYDVPGIRQSGLTLKRDWAVSFHKSQFNGADCYYMRWSAIEFIWVKVKRL
jgi:hypothetical protein